MLGWHFNLPTPAHRCITAHRTRGKRSHFASLLFLLQTTRMETAKPRGKLPGLAEASGDLYIENKVEVAHPPSFPLPSSNWRLRPRRPALNSMKATHMKAAPPYPMFFEICCIFTSEIILWQTRPCLLHDFQAGPEFTKWVMMNWRYTWLDNFFGQLTFWW